MANEKPNKVVLGNQTIIDLTGDTVTENDVLSGKTFHAKNGEIKQGNIGNYGSEELVLDPGDSETLPAGYYSQIRVSANSQDISGKADKVVGATNGNFAGLDSNGNLTDSEKKPSDFLTQHQDISDRYSTNDTAETTLDDADYFPFYDTSATAKKKSLWSNIKSVLKTYFDTLYKGISAHDAWSDVSSKPFSIVSTGLTVTSDALTADIQDFDTTGTASANAVSYQRLKKKGTWYEILGTKYMETSTKTTSGGVDTFSFSNAAILTTSAIDVYCNVYGKSPTDVTVSSGSCLVKFNSSDNVTTCRIYIR